MSNPIHNSLTTRLLSHPAIAAITEWPQSKWACLIIGHQWSWPDIVVCFRPEGLRFLPQWRTCTRCGIREQDEAGETQILVVPTFQGAITGFNQKKDTLGDQVKRAMGWN